MLSPIYEVASNFNPRSRKGSDYFLRRLRCGPIISTHAPARGATRTEVVPYQSIEISTHAPARGATIVRLGHFFIVCYISTHAPARGATQIFWFCMQNHRNFNPRSRKGSDLQLQCYQHQYWNFNPRSRKGSDVFIFWKCH